MENTVLKSLEERRSVRKFKPDVQVDEQKLREILHAATFAPTGMGRQSPIMVVVQDKATREILRKMNAEIMGDPQSDQKKENEGKTIVVLFASCGENCYIEPPLHANWAGKHVHFGKNVYANFGLTLVDDTHIFVGDGTMFGPNVVIATAGHPILPELREKQYQFNIPVHIGKNCWLGAGVLVMPGVTIGDNTVIGAGSVVTKDIPANSVAVGNPCRVLREISDHDKEYYFRDRRIDYTDL